MYKLFKYLSIEYLYGENYCILHDAVLMRVT